MRKFICPLIILSFLFTACYGSWNIFYEGNDVDYRTRTLQEIDSKNAAFAASGISSLSGKYTVLIITDSHFGSIRKAPSVNKLYAWLESVQGNENAPAFALSLGDVVDTGAQCQYDEYIEFCNTLINKYGIKLVFNSCGNHDIYQSHWENWQANCYPYTSLYKFETEGFSWYSIDTASGTIGRQQYSNIVKALSSDKKPKIVFSHYPLTDYDLAFGIGETTERNLLVTQFLKNNVKCYLGGHNHYCHYVSIGLKDYCCPSFNYDNEWALLTVDEENKSVELEYIKK